MKSTWAFRVQAAGDEALTIDIYDAIGDSYFGGVSAKDVLEKLRAAGSVKKIYLRVNSLGGNVFDGFAICNLLRAHAAKVIADVDGVAASAASVLLMGADKIRIAENAMIMIHNSWTIAMGNAKEMAETVEMLHKVDQQIAVTYATRTGQDVAQVQQWMNATTWMTAQEAVERKFADEVTEAREVAASVGDLTQFQNVPEQLLARFKKPEPPQQSTPAPVAANEPKDKTIMTDLEKAQAALASANGEVATLNSKASALQAEIQAQAATIVARDATIVTLTGERDAAQAKIKTSEDARIKAKVAALSGTKLVPTEIEAYTELAVANEAQFDKLMAARPDLKIVSDRLAVDPTAPPRDDSNPQGNEDPLSAAAERAPSAA